jgi:hypothetical protein
MALAMKPAAGLNIFIAELSFVIAAGLLPSGG